MVAFRDGLLSGQPPVTGLMMKSVFGVVQTVAFGARRLGWNHALASY